MAILALDTATPSMSVALGEDDGALRAARTSVMPRAHATHLNEAIDAMLSQFGLSTRDLTSIVVGLGPGSYTGVRIGVTAAKTLAYALGVPVYGVSTLGAAAYSARAHVGLIAAVFDARRGDVYGAGFYAGGGDFSPAVPEGRYRCEEFSQRLCDARAKRGVAPIAMVGDAARVCAGSLRDLGAEAWVYDDTSYISAENVLRLGYLEAKRRLVAGEGGDQESGAHTLVPRYLQLAEAEARWRSKEWGSFSNE